MIPVDESLLRDLRLNSMSETDKNRLLTQIGNTLEARVGAAIVRKLSDAELEEFERIYAAGDPEAGTAWLQSRVPDLQKVTIDELRFLKAEIIEFGGIQNPAEPTGQQDIAAQVAQESSNQQPQESAHPLAQPVQQPPRDTQPQQQQSPKSREASVPQRGVSLEERTGRSSPPKSGSRVDPTNQT